MLTKSEVLKSLQSLPGKFQAEDAIEKYCITGKNQNWYGPIKKPESSFKRRSETKA